MIDIPSRSPPTPSIRLLFSFLTRHDLLWFILPAVLSAICAGVVAPFMTLAIGNAFNAFSQYPTSGATSEDGHRLLLNMRWIALELFGLAVGITILSSLTSGLWIQAGERNLLVIRKHVYSTVTRKELVWFDTETGKDSQGDLGAGGLMAAFAKATDEVRAGSSLACGSIIQYLTTIAVCAILAFVRSWSLTLVILSIIPLQIVVQGATNALVTPNLMRERAHTATAATFVDRAVSSIATVKAFNAQLYEQANLSKALENIQAAANNSVTIWGIEGAVSQFLGLAMLVLGLWYGATLVRSGELSAGDVMTVYWACLILSTSLQSLAPQLITITKGKVAMASLVELIESQPKPTLLRSVSTRYAPLKSARRTSLLRQIVPSSYEGSIELSAVTFSYPSRPDVMVLKDVSISIPAQRMTFIVGASGSGKSTIAQLLLRLYDLPRGSGTIKLGNEDLAYVDENWCREQIASVTQSCILFDMTVHENVAMGVASPMSTRKPEDITREEVEEVCRATLMHGFICDLPDGYNTKLGNGGTSLSGGQKQRLAIARALLRNPTVLILDEATSALDVIGRSLVFEAIKRRRKGQTTIVITHDLSHIDPDDYVYVLKQGICVEQGRRSHLAKHPFSEFSHMLLEQEFDSTEPPSNVNRKADSAPLPFPSAIRTDDVVSEETDLSLELDDEKTATEFRPVLRPLTTSGWMFDVIADLTTPISPDKATPTESHRSGRRHTRRLTMTPVKRRSSVHFAIPGPQTVEKDPSIPSRPLSYHEEELLDYYPPELPRRRSMDFEPADAPKVTREDVLERRKTMVVMSEKRAMTKRSRRTWNQDMLKAILDADKVVEISAPPPVEIPPQPSILQLLREVWPTLASQWLVALGIVLSVVSGVTMPLFSFILSRLQYELTSGAAHLSTINSFGGASLGLAAIYGMLHGLKYFILETTGTVWVNKLRRTCYALILSQDQKWFDKSENGPAHLVQLLIKNGDDACHLFATVLTRLIVVVVTVSVGMIWAFATGWQLTLLAFGMIPLFFVMMGVQMNLVSQCEYRNKCAREEVAQGYYDAITNIRGIRAMGLEAVFQQNYEKIVERALKTGLRGAFIEGCSLGVYDALTYLAEAILLSVGAVLVANGTYNILRMFQTVFLLVFTITFTFQQMSFTQLIAKAIQATHDFNNLLKLDKLTDESRGRDTPLISGALSLRNVTFAYPERSGATVLRNLSLEIKENECVAIVGKSGSGKSTIAALLQRLYEPKAGSVAVGKCDVTTIDVKYLRDHVAVVSQQPYLFDATVAENITYGAESISDDDIQAAARAANVHDFIMSLPNGYETVIGENASLVSGGQAQRIQIARALVRPSNILILDECTSALDPVNEAAVMEAIKQATVGRTTIMITHKLQLMQACDRVIVVQDGEIVEEGTYEDLTQKDRQSALSQLVNGGVWQG